MNSTEEDFSSPVLRCIRESKKYARVLRQGDMSDEEIRNTVMTTISEAIREDDEASRRAVLGMVSRAVSEALAEPKDHPYPADTPPRFPIHWGVN